MAPLSDSHTRANLNMLNGFHVAVAYTSCKSQTPYSEKKRLQSYRVGGRFPPLTTKNLLKSEKREGREKAKFRKVLSLRPLLLLKLANSAPARYLDDIQWVCVLTRWHGNANYIQNPPTVTSPTKELYNCRLFFCRYGCRAVQRDKSQIHPYLSPANPFSAFDFYHGGNLCLRPHCVY